MYKCMVHLYFNACYICIILLNENVTNGIQENNHGLNLSPTVM